MSTSAWNQLFKNLSIEMVLHSKMQQIIHEHWCRCITLMCRANSTVEQWGSVWLLSSCSPYLIFHTWTLFPRINIFDTKYFFPLIADEMLESEKSGLAGRVHDLERRVLTQQDEIVCLRSTLADVLRRLNLIEGNIERGAINNSSLGSVHGGRSAPNTPSRNGTPNFSRRKYSLANSSQLFSF